jgi:hypothetical protein
VYDNYKADYELAMKDLQGHTINPCPLYIKEEYCVEISHPGSAEDI